MTYPSPLKSPSPSPPGKQPNPGAAPQTEIGYMQAIQYNWWLYEQENTPELQWPQSIAVFEAMRRTDSQVTSVLRAVTLPVRRTPWRIDPNGARKEVVEFVANDLGLPVVGQVLKPPPRSKDRFVWSEHLRQALLMLPFGYSYFEQVYRVNDAGTEAHLAKLALRPARTIQYIDVAPDGGLVSIQQFWVVQSERPEPIPVSRLVAYIHEKEGGNWLGTSILRPVYKNWLLKDRLMRVQAQTIERNGMGVPLYKAQEDAQPSDMQAGLAMAKSWRSGEAAGSAVPHGADLVLRGVEGQLPDAEPAIRYHDEQIARAVLAHFLNLGTQTGSWALGTSFADFFTLSLQTLAQQVADTATCHIIEDLVDINFGPDEPAPRLVFDEIGSQQPGTASALKLLIDSGVIHPDAVLEESTRQQYGLPAKDPNAPAVPPPIPGLVRESLTGLAPGALPPNGSAPAAAPATPAVPVAASEGSEGRPKESGTAEADDAQDADDEAVEILLQAAAEFSGEIQAAAFNPSVHPRNPKGSAGGGRFRSLVDRLVDALKAHHQSGGKGDPFNGFSREQLRRAAVKRGIILKRGATRDDISAALIADLTSSTLTGPTAPNLGPAGASPPSGQSMLDRVVKAYHQGQLAGGTGDPFKGFTKDQLRDAAVSTGRISFGSGPVTRVDLVRDLTAILHAHYPPPTSGAAAVDPVVKAAQDVLYGVDPKSTTAARQLSAYGAMRRGHFDSLDPQEQSTVLGDLSYIAANSRGPNKAKAQTLIDRFAPPGTPPGTIPKPPVITPSAAVPHQMHVADPLGTAGLLKVRPATQRGRSGDGWTVGASGRSGPWGQYGASGLMLRHVDSSGVERFLMVERGPGISDPGKWQFPGGAKEERESFYEGAAREVVEELGLKPTDLDAARVHGTHTAEVPSVSVPGVNGGTVPWAYVSVAATVPTQLMPDLSTHHARMETSDAKWMTAAEIDALDQKGKLLAPLAGGALQQNVMSLFPSTSKPGSGTGRKKPARLDPSTRPQTPALPRHKPSRGVDLMPDKASKDRLRQDVKKARPMYAGKVADDRLAAIGAMQGYDATPTVVTKAEMDQLLATGDYIEAWRGVRGAGAWSRPGSNRGGGTVSRSKTAAEINEDMRSGVAYYGAGVFGNGYYLAETKSVAAGYSDSSKNSVIRILIPKSAMFIDHSGALAGAKADGSPTSKAKGSYEDGTLWDEGRWAAAKGYAGIRISHTAYGRHGGASHVASPGQNAWNWLDRSTLIVQEAE